MKEQAALELGLGRRELSDTLTKELLDRQRRSATMAFDYKKEYKALYQPPREPQFVTVPAMTFAAVRGQGDPNDPTGEYKAAIELLYGLLYTIKMSKKGSHRVDGYFDFVVPPLEGLWEQTGTGKESFHWTSMLRLPEFVTREVTQLDSGKSTMRYLPPKDTAGFAVFCVSAYKREPRPPARIIATISFAIALFSPLTLTFPLFGNERQQMIV